MSGPDVLTEADLAFLMDEGSVEVERDDANVLRDLSRRISAQYVDVLAAYAAELYRGKPTSGARAQVDGAIDALDRLGRAIADRELCAVLGRFRAVTSQGDVKGRARERVLGDLREVVGALAALLPRESAARLSELVECDVRRAPLLVELAQLRGLGPKRLERLYCAGLFTVEAVVGADPAEIALATGLSLVLAGQVVEATREFARDRGRRLVATLRDDLLRLREALTDGALDDGLRVEVAALLADHLRTFALPESR